MREIINFSTKFESLEVVNPLITKYRINICVPDKPANKYVFSKEVIEGMSNTIKGAGVYGYYFQNEEQLGGHSDDIVKTKKGYKRTGEPIAYGFSDPYKNPYWMEIDGESWYTAEVYLWTGRNPEIEEVLKTEVFHSMEVAVDNEVDSFGNKNVTDAIFLGFCLLQGINPAFEGSKIQKFSLPVSDEEIDLLKKEYEKFSEKEKEGDSVIKEVIENINEENVEEMSTEEMVENKKDEEIETEDLSSNDYVDNTAMETLNEKTAEDNKELSNEYVKESDEENKDETIILMKDEISQLTEKLSKLESDMAVYVEENNQLKDFKASIEKQNKEFSIETTLQEVADVLPKEEIEACRLSAENFSFDNIDVWKNEVKAKAYSFSKGTKDKKPFIQVGLPISSSTKRGTGLWD